MQNIKDMCLKIGESNKATYAVVSIAVAKGIFRPIFTLLDKNESKETKKYTATREGLTEVVAIPTYIGVGKLAEVIAGKLKGLSPEKLEIAKHNANFIGVCIAALLVIPALASIVTKPFSNKEQKNNEKSHKLDIREAEVSDTLVSTPKIVRRNDTIKQYSQISMEKYLHSKPVITKVGAP